MGWPVFNNRGGDGKTRFSHRNVIRHSRPLQMKLHELKRFALGCLRLLAIAPGQTMFGVGNLVKLKGDSVDLARLHGVAPTQGVGVSQVALG